VAPLEVRRGGEPGGPVRKTRVPARRCPRRAIDTADGAVIDERRSAGRPQPLPPRFDDGPLLPRSPRTWERAYPCRRATERGVVSHNAVSGQPGADRQILYIGKRCATRQDLSLKNGPDPASRQSVLMTARGVKDSATGLSSSIWNAITHERQRNRAGEAVLVDLNFGAGACFEIQFRLPYVMRE
jgi:hypothetical protein